MPLSLSPLAVPASVAAPSGLAPSESSVLRRRPLSFCQAQRSTFYSIESARLAALPDLYRGLSRRRQPFDTRERYYYQGELVLMRALSQNLWKNGGDSFQLLVGVFDTCLAWYLLVLSSGAHAAANMSSKRARDGATSYHSTTEDTRSSLEQRTLIRRGL